MWRHGDRHGGEAFMTCLGLRTEVRIWTHSDASKARAPRRGRKTQHQLRRSFEGRALCEIESFNNMAFSERVSGGCARSTGSTHSLQRATLQCSEKVLAPSRQRQRRGVPAWNYSWFQCEGTSSAQQQNRTRSQDEQAESEVAAAFLLAGLFMRPLYEVLRRTSLSAC